MDVHTVISLNVSVGIAPILKSDNVWQLRQQTHFIPCCRGSWTSRTSRSSRQAPVGLGRFQYEVVMTRDQHTHKQRQPPSFCHRHTFPKHFLLGSSKTHRCLALRWLCEGFFHWMIARSAHEDHIQVSSLRSARQVVDEQILIFKNAWLGWSRFASPVFFLGLSWWQL